MPNTRTTIYLDSVTYEDDADTFRTVVSDRYGNSVEIISCPRRYVAALKDAQVFWEEFQRKHAEVRVAQMGLRKRG
jgi:hypothetical protein